MRFRILPSIKFQAQRSEAIAAERRRIRAEAVKREKQEEFARETREMMEESKREASELEELEANAPEIPGLDARTISIMLRDGMSLADLRNTPAARLAAGKPALRDDGVLLVPQPADEEGVTTFQGVSFKEYKPGDPDYQRVLEELREQVK
jgi:hypothetical protein